MYTLTENMNVQHSSLCWPNSTAQAADLHHQSGCTSDHSNGTWLYMMARDICMSVRLM